MSINKFTEYPKLSGIRAYKKGETVPIYVATSSSAISSGLVPLAGMKNLVVYMALSASGSACYAGIDSLSNVNINVLSATVKGYTVANNITIQGRYANCESSVIGAGSASMLSSVYTYSTESVASDQSIVTYGDDYRVGYDKKTVETIRAPKFYVESYSPAIIDVLSGYASVGVGGLAIFKSGSVNTVGGVVLANSSRISMDVPHIENKAVAISRITVSNYFGIPVSGFGSNHLWYYPDGTAVSNVATVTSNSDRRSASVVIAGAGDANGTYVIPGISACNTETYFRNVKSSFWMESAPSDPNNYKAIVYRTHDDGQLYWDVVRFSKVMSGDKPVFNEAQLLYTPAFVSGSTEKTALAGPPTVATGDVDNPITASGTGGGIVLNYGGNGAELNDNAMYIVGPETNNFIHRSGAADAIVDATQKRAHMETMTLCYSHTNFLSLVYDSSLSRTFLSGVLYSATVYAHDIDVKNISAFSGTLNLGSGAILASGSMIVTSSNGHMAHITFADSCFAKAGYKYVGTDYSDLVVHSKAHIKNLTFSGTHGHLEYYLDRYWAKNGVIPGSAMYLPDAIVSVGWTAVDGAVHTATITSTGTSTIGVELIENGSATSHTLTRSYDQVTEDEFHDTDKIYSNPEEVNGPYIMDTEDTFVLYAYDHTYNRYVEVAKANSICPGFICDSAVTVAANKVDVHIGDRCDVSGLTLSGGLGNSLYLTGAANVSGLVFSANGNIYVTGYKFNCIHNPTLIGSANNGTELTVGAYATVDLTGDVALECTVDPASQPNVTLRTASTYQTIRTAYNNLTVPVSCITFGTVVSSQTHSVDVGYTGAYRAYRTNIVENTVTGRAPTYQEFPAGGYIDGVKPVGVASATVGIGATLVGATRDGNIGDGVVTVVAGGIYDPANTDQYDLYETTGGTVLATVSKVYGSSTESATASLKLYSYSNCAALVHSSAGDTPAPNTPMWFGYNETAGSAYIVRASNGKYIIQKGTFVDGVFTKTNDLAAATSAIPANTTAQPHAYHAATGAAVKFAYNGYDLVPSGSNVYYRIEEHASQMLLGSGSDLDLHGVVVRTVRDSEGYAVKIDANRFGTWVNGDSTYHDSGYTVTHNGRLTVSNKTMVGVTILSKGIVYPYSGAMLHNVTKEAGAVVTYDMAREGWDVEGDAERIDYQVDGALGDHLFVKGSEFTGTREEVMFNIIDNTAVGDDRRWTGVTSSFDGPFTVTQSSVISVSGGRWVAKIYKTSAYTDTVGILESAAEDTSIKNAILGKTAWYSGVYTITNGSAYRYGRGVGALTPVTSLDAAVSSVLPSGAMFATADGSHAICHSGDKVYMYASDSVENKYLVADILDGIVVSSDVTTTQLEDEGKHTRDPWWIYRSGSVYNTGTFVSGAYIKRVNTHPFMFANQTSQYQVWKFQSGDALYAAQTMNSGLCIKDCFVGAVVMTVGYTTGTTYVAGYMSNCSGILYTASQTVLGAIKDVTGYNAGITCAYSNPRGFYISGVNLSGAAKLNLTGGADGQHTTLEKFVTKDPILSTNTLSWVVPEEAVRLSRFETEYPIVSATGTALKFDSYGPIIESSGTYNVCGYKNYLHPTCYGKFTSTTTTYQFRNEYTEMALNGQPQWTTSYANSGGWPNIVPVSGVHNNGVVNAGDTLSMIRNARYLDLRFEGTPAITYTDAGKVPRIVWVTPMLTEHDTNVNWYTESAAVELVGASTADAMSTTSWTPPVFTSNTAGLTGRINYLYKDLPSALGSAVVESKIVHVRQGATIGRDVALSLGLSGGIFVESNAMVIDLDVNSLSGTYNVSTANPDSKFANTLVHKTHYATVDVMKDGICIIAPMTFTNGGNSAEIQANLSAAKQVWHTFDHGRTYVGRTHTLNRTTYGSDVIGFLTNSTCQFNNMPATGLVHIFVNESNNYYKEGTTERKYTYPGIGIYGTFSRGNVVRTNAGMLYIGSSGNLTCSNLSVGSGGMLLLESGAQLHASDYILLFASGRTVLMDGGIVDFNVKRDTVSNFLYAIESSATIMVRSNFILSNMPSISQRYWDSALVEGTTYSAIGPDSFRLSRAIDLCPAGGLPGADLIFSKTASVTTVSDVQYPVYSAAARGQTVSMQYESGITRYGKTFDGWVVRGNWEPEPGEVSSGILYVCSHNNPLGMDWVPLSTSMCYPFVGSESWGTSSAYIRRDHNVALVKVYDCGHTDLGTYDNTPESDYPTIVHVNGILTTTVTGEVHVGAEFCSSGVITSSAIIHLHDCDRYKGEPIPIKFASSGTVVYHGNTTIDLLGVDHVINVSPDTMKFSVGGTYYHDMVAAESVLEQTMLKHGNVVIDSTTVSSAVQWRFITRETLVSAAQVSPLTVGFTNTMSSVTIVNVNAAMYTTGYKLDLKSGGTMVVSGRAHCVRVGSGASAIIDNYARNVVVEPGGTIIVHKVGEDPNPTVDNLYISSGGTAYISGYVTGFEMEVGATVDAVDSSYVRTSSFFTKEYTWSGYTRPTA